MPRIRGDDDYCFTLSVPQNAVLEMLMAEWMGVHQVEAEAVVNALEPTKSLLQLQQGSKTWPVLTIFGFDGVLNS